MRGSRRGTDGIWIAVLGLGEAGSIYAQDLAARGLKVTATDPAVEAVPLGVVPAGSISEAVTGAGLVLSLVGGRAAEHVLQEALPAMEPGALFADLNTSGPDQKRRLAEQAARRNVLFADVAVLAPVPRSRIDSPLLISGTGADALASLFGGWGIPATTAGIEAGAAAGLKLLRSVFMKGLAAVILESVTAAEAAGAKEWMIGQIAGELGPSGPALVARMLEGTGLHAVRREAEMLDVRAFLESLGTPHPVTDAAIAWLQSLAHMDQGRIADSPS
ncbi:MULTISPECIES: NAD(P)-binding domain-containing protein [Arthrobacter]|uniref:NAD(P)-binding domain-containing protein n=1 Tax=Arthrobacter TaxID=1663 RepID=UPI001F01877E|nr:MULTISPECIES: NAD(P)-binding domain-containing protein [Arthrobacter]MDP9985695.1 3-hydroxyisobutyrate dehydrogenase-like beta-hydroxyacid dehydrogenase [Arthrobacter oryzae]UKA75428.1 NAD(P)-binding domain-containing protein [Arthrobacter sp. FW306-07-I]